MLKYLTGLGFTRGLLGGSRRWTAVLVLAGVARLVQRSNRPKVVFRHELAPGETLVVTGGRPIAAIGGDGIKMSG